jgi:flagellar FliL protein
MAKHSETPAEGEDSGKSKKRPLILIGVVAVLALLIGGGVAWFFMGHKSEPHAAVGDAKPKHAAGAPVFVTLEPFVVNLAGDVQHYLQVGIDLRVVDGHVPDQIKVHLPEIRNAVLLLLSSKSVEDLSSIEQKNRLRDEIREAVNKPLGINPPAPKPNPTTDAAKPEGIGEAQAAEHLAPKPESAKAEEHKTDEEAGVVEVLLTSFVIQ